MYTPFSLPLLMEIVNSHFTGTFGSEDFFRHAFTPIISTTNNLRFPLPDSTSINRWINGKRPLPKEFVQLCLDDEKVTVSKILDGLKTAYIDSHIFNLESAALHLTDTIRGDNSIDYREKEYFMHYHADSDPYEAIASALLLAVKLNRTKKEISFPPLQLRLNMDLWLASQRDYLASHNPGGRFHSLSIIRQLLPQGYVADTVFPSRGKTEDGNIEPLANLCTKIADHIAIVGDGGIGKTTFLQLLLTKEFVNPDGTPKKFHAGNMTPFFIELNRCPDHIGDWHSSSLKKTNFITRYIGQILENHTSLDTVSDETLDMIEKELQKSPDNSVPQYLLLLDGFNEVRATGNVRTCLSNEITVLHGYPNVRIITTSRETQSAYYASEFANIQLIGLLNDDIISYMENCKLPEPVIGAAMANDSLVDCLRIPLYLCMFTSTPQKDGYLPETAGEILHSFFHRNSEFYNVRQRASETRTIQLTNSQTAFVLDFILPYIGWTFDKQDTFSLNALEFKNAICDGMRNIGTLLLCSDVHPFHDFDYQKNTLLSVHSSFYSPSGDVLVDEIMSCMFDYLGIIYQYKVNEGNFADRIRNSFCHHHFRDYFSAMWDVQLLSMLQCVDADQFAPADATGCTFHDFLNVSYWQTGKVLFISEILMEHRNRPVFNRDTGNWMLPPPKYDAQKVLSAALGYCRILGSSNIDTHHILRNVLSAILTGRKDFSGLDLSCLDLTGFSLFGITCSRPGRTRTLAAKFDGSCLSVENFDPEDHMDSIMEYLYCGNQCFTVDDMGIIKCWDSRSGILEYSLESPNPLGTADFSRKGFIKVSNDGHWLAVKVQDEPLRHPNIYINLFDLSRPTKQATQLIPNGKHSLLTFFGFTEDSKGLIALCDRKIVYCFDIETQEIAYCHACDFMKQTDLYSASIGSAVYVHTAEYDVYQEEIEDDYWENEEGFYEEENEEYDGFAGEIPCQISQLDPMTGKITDLHGYCGVPGESPCTLFIADRNAFLLFDYTNMHIELFDCTSMQAAPILTELTDLSDIQPAAFHQSQENPGVFYVMYPDICFSVDIDAIEGNSILMKYPVSSIEKLIPNSDLDGELMFKPYVAPVNRHFIVGNDTNTYEWDAENDALTLRYNTVFYDCVDFFRLHRTNQFMLIHRTNCISIFGGEPLHLQNQFCFHEPGYLIGNCCYDDTSCFIALAFTRPDHEKAILLHPATGEQRTVFSALHKGETIETMCFSKNGEQLLLTTQYRCVEYDIANDTLQTVTTSGSNERLLSGTYRGDEIEVGAAEHSLFEEPRVKTRCDYYLRAENDGKISYQHQWYYIIPEMNEIQSQYFIYRNGDLGEEGPHDESGFQTCWITEGFFLEELPELHNILNPECYRLENGHPITFKKHFEAQRKIYVRHTKALANRYRSMHSKYTYMYLSDDMKEAVLTEDTLRLSYQKNLKTLTYQILEKDFKRNMGESENHGYWDFAAPWTDELLVGCMENYHLVPIEIKTGKCREGIFYTPGISIHGCSFRNVKTDSTTEEMILKNGGIIST